MTGSPGRLSGKRRWLLRGLAFVLFLAPVAFGAVLAEAALAQGPPTVDPPVETPPTAAGLGDCVQGMKAAVLNDAFNALPEDQSKRNGNGGFETFIVLNCRAFEIHWEVLDEFGRVVPGGTGTYEIYNEIDEVDWIDLQTIVYQRHLADVVDGDGNIIAYAGDPVLDGDGNAIPANEQPEPVVAYRFKYTFANDGITDPVSGESKRPLDNSRDYQLRFEINPYANAPDNHIFSWVFEIVAKLSGNWWQKIIRVLSPINWIDEGLTFIFRGYGSLVMGVMCESMGNVMTADERMAFTKIDSDGDGKITAMDDDVVDASDPNKPNANGNCKKPAKSPEDQLEELRTANYRLANENRALAGLAPLPERPAKRDTYLFELIDGSDPRDRSRPFGERVAYEISHLTLAPRLVANNVAASPLQGIQGGITTFTGLLTGTPPELTYERGIVRIGWSVLFNITFVVIGFVIAWIGFTQVLRVFLGGTRSLADWRETIPRLLLAVLGALLSYWFCSVCIDIADGVSRYIAAAMRITPADITLTLGQALIAIFLKNLQSTWLAAVPIIGQFLVGVKVVTVGFLVLLMKIFAISVLLVVAQFVMRIGILNVLIVTSPLGMLMWALPETSGWGRRWVSLFLTTLFQHGVQLICFAIALWFIRLATPVGIVADTGVVSGQLQAVLPTQMAYALILGTILMIVTFKIPSMLGQGGLQESFVSTISMAALGFRALGMIAGGGAGGSGPLGFLGLTGNSGGPPGITPGGLSSSNPVTGVNTGVTASVSTRAAAVAAGGFRAARAGISVLRGGEGYSNPAVSQRGAGDAGDPGDPDAPGVSPTVGVSAPPPPSAGPTTGPPGQREASSPGTDREYLRQQLGDSYVDRGEEDGVRAVSPYYINEGGAVRATTGTERAAIRSMGPDRFNNALNGRGTGGERGSPAESTREGAGVQRGRERQADDQSARQVLGAEQYARANAGNLRSAGGPYMVDQGRTRLASPQERQLMGQIGQARFNRLFGGDSSGRTSRVARLAAQTQDTQPAPRPQRGPQMDDRSVVMARFGGPGGLASAAQGNLRAINSNYVRDDNGMRLANPAERNAIRTVGTDSFNNVMRDETEGGRGLSERQSYLDGRNARDTLGDDAYDRAREAQLRSLGGPYMSDSGQTRFATPEERKLLGDMGRSRFNRLFGPRPEARTTGQAGVSQAVGAGYEDTPSSRPSLGSQLREAMREGYTEHMEGARVPLIRDQSGRVVPESEDGKTARGTLGGDEYAAKASRQIRYMGSGAWANVGGRPTPLSSDQSYARNVMGNDEFARSLNRSIRSTGTRDGEGRSLVTDEGTQRPATSAEQRLLDDESFGGGRFNRMMGERAQFMGEGDFVRDNGTPRLASQNESRLLGQVGEERFNDVMGRRFEEAGTGYRVDAMPTREQVVGQARDDTVRIAREVRERGSEVTEGTRDAIQGTGIRTGGLGDIGRGVREEMRGEERPQAYDAQRASRSERRRRESSGEFYGMKTDME